MEKYKRIAVLIRKNDKRNVRDYDAGFGEHTVL